MRVTLNLLCLQPATAPILPSSQAHRGGLNADAQTDSRFCRCRRDREAARGDSISLRVVA